MNSPSFTWSVMHDMKKNHTSKMAGIPRVVPPFAHFSPKGFHEPFFVLLNRLNEKGTTHSLSNKVWKFCYCRMFCDCFMFHSQRREKQVLVRVMV